MKILLCSDGHAPAERAARFVCSATAAAGAEITLLGIIEHPSDESALGESLRRSADLLRRQNLPVEIITRNGKPLAEIQRRTQEERYDLVAIGAERKPGGPFALSAKAQHVMKEVEPPVLAVIGERTDVKKALICSGGGRSIEKAVELTACLLAKSSVSVTLLHVLAEAPVIYSDLLNEEAESRNLLAANSTLARNLRSELGRLGAANLPADIKLRHGLVTTQILRELHEGSYDLVIAGSAPTAGALRTYVMGDITSEILSRADCAVLVVRSAPAPAPGFLARFGKWFRQTPRKP